MIRICLSMGGADTSIEVSRTRVRRRPDPLSLTRWEKLYQEERKYWFTFGFHGWLLLLTIIYEVAVPIHAGLAIIPPMLVSLLATTRPFTSGVALGLYLMLPLKFFPLKDWVRVAMAVTGVGAGA